jgi:hypothetical protein
VKGNNGFDYLDKLSNSEIEENKFTQLELFIRNKGSKNYLFGSRKVQLLDSEGYIRAFDALGNGVKLSEVSGKVVMQLPTNITGIDLSKTDIGLEKSFAGGVVTLKEIKEDYISFKFTGKDESIFAWSLFDDSNTVIHINDIVLNDGIYHLYSENPKSVRIYQSEIVHKEYPFSFRENSGSETAENTVSQEPELKSAQDAVEDKNKSSVEYSSQNIKPTYLDKNDFIFISIKDRVVNDMKKTADYESIENKTIAAKIKSLTGEKKNQLDTLFVKSISDYTAKINFDAGTLMTVFKNLAGKPVIKIYEENDIRILQLGEDNYVAEFWEDGLAVNSEEHAIAWANELISKYPDDSEILKNVKETYANARKSIEEGEVDRYSKVMALLYTKEKDGTLTYHNPFQIMIDFNGN